MSTEAAPGFSCIFCHGASESTKLTKQHLLAKPVCRGFDVDRSVRVTDPFNPEHHPLPLDEVQVRIACDRCNSGWMNDLENSLEEVAWRWYRNGATPLSSADALTLKAWVAMTYVVWSAYAGRIRTFNHPGDAQWSVIPPADTGGFLYAGSWARAAESMVFGWGKLRVASPHLFAFGNPRLLGDNRSSGLLRASGALRLNLGRLQLWGVHSLYGAGQVRLPGDVLPVAEGVSFRRLPVVPAATGAEAVTVTANIDLFRTLDIANEVARSLMNPTEA